MGLAVLDAGVLIGALDSDDAHYEAAVSEITGAQKRGDNLLVPMSAYAEILVKPALSGSAMVKRLDAALGALGVEVIDGTRDIARRAAKLRAKHATLRLPDALVIASALELNADYLLTTDKKWKRLNGLGLHGKLIIVD